jgi:hypothetical protein
MTTPRTPRSRKSPKNKVPATPKSNRKTEKPVRKPRAQGQGAKSSRRAQQIQNEIALIAAAQKQKEKEDDASAKQKDEGEQPRWSAGTAKMGRPPVYHPELCDFVLSIAQGGLSLTGMAVRIGVARDTVYDWIEKYPDFSDAMKRAREISLAAWEEHMRNGLWGGKAFNPQVLTFAMPNMFPADYKQAGNNLDLTSGGQPIKVTISADDAKL